MGKVLHASYSGYFPFCIKPLEENPEYIARVIEEGRPDAGEPGSEWPIGLTDEEAMSLFWKIRTIKADADGLSGTTNLTYRKSILAPSPVEPATEEEIVCANYRLETFGYITNGASFISIQILLEGACLKIENNQRFYYPRILIESNQIVEDPPESNSSVSYTDPFYSYTQQGSYNLLGFGELPLFTISSAQGAYPFTITPHKYWSYGGTWDEDTGEPL
jgi:hypothetical protein